MEHQTASTCQPPSFSRLAPEQRALYQKIMAFITDNPTGCFIIYGAAGTGKSFFLSCLFNEIQTLAREAPHSPLFHTDNYLVVNHHEMLKAYKNQAEHAPALKKKHFSRPTSFINERDKKQQTADIVLVDEAHLLLTKTDRYNHFYYDNQLEEIIKRARFTILTFDEKQVIKGRSLWNHQRLAHYLNGKKQASVQLKKQYRMFSPPPVTAWIAALGQGKITPWPKAHDADAFTLQIFADAQEMYERIVRLNQRYGLARMLSTYDYPYRLDGNDYYIHAGRFHLRWDRALPEARLPWAERDDTIEEVGSVYTVQGFDLNYAGVILGPSVGFDPATHSLVMKPEHYEDSAAFAGLANYDDGEELKRALMLNSLNVLLSRPRHGLFLYAHDPVLREYLLELSRGNH